MKSLDEVDGGKTKQKREARSNSIYMDDEFAEATNEHPEIRGNYDVKTSESDVEVPMKGGSPAFSIHASKVYILYPSLFQDPNIFGRFSIPQNINLDPIPDKKNDKKSSPTSAVQQNDPPVVLKPNVPSSNANQYSRNVNSDPYNPYRRLTRRQAENPPPSPSSNDDENRKRNVETHLTGTIVVLNQDVNEINRKDAY